MWRNESQFTGATNPKQRIVAHFAVAVTAGSFVFSVLVDHARDVSYGLVYEWSIWTMMTIMCVCMWSEAYGRSHFAPSDKNHLSGSVGLLMISDSHNLADELVHIARAKWLATAQWMIALFVALLMREFSDGSDPTMGDGGWGAAAAASNIVLMVNVWSELWLWWQASRQR